MRERGIFRCLINPTKPVPYILQKIQLTTKKAVKLTAFFVGLSTKLLFASHRFGEFNKLWAVHDGA